MRQKNFKRYLRVLENINETVLLCADIHDHLAFSNSCHDVTLRHFQG